MTTIIEAKDVRKRFGGVHALGGCSLTIDTGEITGLIGPNGSGKTTLLNVLTGYVRRDSGRLYFAGKEISRPDPARLYHLGLGRTFQYARVFPEITVLENLAVAKRHAWTDLIRRPLHNGGRERAMEVLERFGLQGLANDPAGELSYGQRRLLEIAAVLIGEPEVVMLDEPTAGISPMMTEKLEQHIRDLHASGVTFVVIEHNMEFVMRLCDRIIVLDQGCRIADGPPAEIISSQLVLDVYLGE